jgi:predicted GIY-YIG superfamily endonuclease
MDVAARLRFFFFCFRTKKAMSVVYCLVTPDQRFTYVGATKNLTRRLRQHNGEITGGAKYTKRSKSWRVLFYLEGFADSSEGWRETLSCEWHLKHVSRYRKGTSPVARRERNVTTLLKRQRWAHLKKIVPSQQMGISWSDESADCAPQCASPRAKASGDDDDARSVQSALPADAFTNTVGDAIDDAVPASAASL